MSRTYLLTMFLWLLVGILAGLLIGPLFPLSPQEALFVVVLVVGSSVVLLLNSYAAPSPWRKKIRETKLLPASLPTVQPVPERQKKAATKPADGHVATRVDLPDRVLSNDEARQWLDALLLRQQRGDGSS